jgi:serine/threonine protein kinase/tetratricopeptide (TPR) repeat protein
MGYQPGDRLSQYVLVERAGEGGMGVVWKALDTRLDRSVALKLLPDELAGDPDRLRRFDREARALAVLKHPNIVTVYAVEEADGRHFFTMEYVDGLSLAERVPHGGLPLGAFFGLALQLVDAVRAAHECGITHRDLKPGNIMVTQSDGLKVLDFGLARFDSDMSRSEQAAQKPHSERTTQIVSLAGRLLGTPAFMAPEQIRGKRADRRSDVFSLGGILYFMLTGRMPFTGETLPALFGSILHDAPSPLETLRPSTPDSLVRLVDRCLAKSPAERFEDATAVHAALCVAETKVGADANVVRSIAVLPFDDLSPNKNQGHLCEGLAEEIMFALGKIKGLRVASRSAAFGAKALIAEGENPGRRLGVETVLEGSVRKSDGRVRISVELSDVAGGYQLWTERYDRDVADIFAIQDEIATGVASVLRGPVTTQTRPTPGRSSTLHVQAYDFYLRGRAFFYQYSRKGVDFALEMFTRATELDPEYARAHAGIADCHAFLYLYGGRHQTSLDEAERASGRAVELAPDSADAHAARGTVLSLRDDHAAAEAEFQRAIALDPGLFEAHYSYARACFAAGRLEDAVRLYDRAGKLRPDDYQSPLLVAQALEALGRQTEADEVRRRGVETAKRHVRLHPDDIRALYMLANGLVALGERDEGLTWARRALALDPEEPMLLYNIGCIYALAGITDEALECLERSVRHGLTQLGWFKNDANLDVLREHPRFRKLIAKLEQLSPHVTS